MEEGNKSRVGVLEPRVVVGNELMGLMVEETRGVRPDRTLPPYVLLYRVVRRYYHTTRA